MTFLIIQGTTEADIVIFETFYKENNFNAGTNETNQQGLAIWAFDRVDPIR